MSGTDGMTRAMDLSDRQIPVEIEGRQFVLKQLPRVPLQKILDLLYNSPEEGEKKGKGKTKELNGIDIICGEWEKALPIIARMLGFDPDKNPDSKTEFDSVVQYLDENLAPPAGVRIYMAWRELNEIDDFFARAGRTLLEPKLAAMLKEGRELSLDREIQQVMEEQKAETA